VNGQTEYRILKTEDWAFMEEFEISRNITIGQYLALESFIHRMDPRVKLVSFALLVAAITFSPSLTANAILLFVVLALVPFSKIPIRYALSGLKPAIPIVLVLAAFQILFYTLHLPAVRFA